MEKMKTKLLNSKVLPNFIASFALVCTIIGANTTCCGIFHQPEKPDMKNLRKY